MKVRLFNKTLAFGLMTTFALGSACQSYKRAEVNQAEIDQAVKQAGDGVYALMATNKGDMLIELYYDKTPLTVANFVGLAEGELVYDTIKIEKPFYDGLIFHRVIKNFMIQGGDPEGKGTGGSGYKFNDEIVADLKHDGSGVLSMANSGANTNGSQFFITHTATPWLDGRHTVFGKVIAGLNIVDSIALVPVETGDRPVDSVQIYHVEIIRKGSEAKAFKGKDLFQKQMQEIAGKQMQESANAKQGILDFAKSKHATAEQTASGLAYVIEKQGTGNTPQKGQTVSVHYTGMLKDGTRFDSSYDRNQPISFPVGLNVTIPGFEEGIMLLAKGGKATLYIPYFLAYGERAMGPIPSKADLIFEIELVEIKDK
jgi:peptidyl-prolyl cis-trans isomerase A (cyclophilin A)